MLVSACCTWRLSPSASGTAIVDPKTTAVSRSSDTCWPSSRRNSSHVKVPDVRITDAKMISPAAHERRLPSFSLLLSLKSKAVIGVLAYTTAEISHAIGKKW